MFGTYLTTLAWLHGRIHQSINLVAKGVIQSGKEIMMSYIHNMFTLDVISFLSPMKIHRANGFLLLFYPCAYSRAPSSSTLIMVKIFPCFSVCSFLAKKATASAVPSAYTVRPATLCFNANSTEPSGLVNV